MPPFDVTLAGIDRRHARVAPLCGGRPPSRIPSVGASGRRRRSSRSKPCSSGLLQGARVFNKVMSLTERTPARPRHRLGGDHAIALAKVAGTLSIDALVLMPKGRPASTWTLTTKYGARIELLRGCRRGLLRGRGLRGEGMLFVHPYDDPAIIAGHGTLGLEFLDDAPDLTHVFVSIGGGGFMAGVSAALKARRPDDHLWRRNVGAPDHDRSPSAEEPVTIRATSIARTLGAPFATHRTIAAAKAFLKDIVLVEDPRSSRIFCGCCRPRNCSASRRPPACSRPPRGWRRACRTTPSSGWCSAAPTCRSMTCGRMATGSRRSKSH